MPDTLLTCTVVAQVLDMPATGWAASIKLACRHHAPIERPTYR